MWSLVGVGICKGTRGAACTARYAMGSFCAPQACSRKGFSTDWTIPRNAPVRLPRDGDGTGKRDAIISTEWDGSSPFVGVAGQDGNLSLRGSAVDRENGREHIGEYAGV